MEQSSTDNPKNHIIMNKLILSLLSQMGWIKRQALKAAGYVTTAVSAFLIAKLGWLHQAGLISDDTLATGTDAVTATGVVITAVVLITAEAVASYFAKSRKE
jgi:hypothetical protein